jgi:uncharacterized membrane protein YfcA
MHNFTPHHLLYSLSGFLVGLLVGQTGVGGGALMTPLLVLLFGMHPASAVGTDLLYACVTKSVGTIVHGKHRSVDWRVVARLAAGSVPATALTLAILPALGGLTGHGADRMIAEVLGGALILTSLTLLFRQRLRSLASWLGTPPR